jgi:arabinofuranosyltransferase
MAVLFLVVLVRTAWVCDDAFITFRTVDNFVNGYGLRWNIAERVQSFTHPLWMLLYAAAYALTGEPYFTSVWLSIAVSMLAFVVAILWIARDLRAAIIGALLLVSSRAFVDYSTSGLENPLTHLLLAAFVTAWFRRQQPFFQTALFVTAGLAVLNRQDSLLLILPALIVAGRELDRRRFVQLALLGAAPLLAWEAFSILYYGLFVPNTAFAKLNTGIGSIELVRQGLTYFLDSLRRDPLVLPTTIACVTTTIVRRSAGAMPIGAGVLLYLFYVVWIGGDFMSGRFLSAPYFLAVLALMRLRVTTPVMAPAIAAAIVLVTVVGYDRPPFSTGGDFGVDDPDQKKIDPVTGIADERRFYYPDTGYRRVLNRGDAIAIHPWADIGLRYRQQGPAVVVSGNIGFSGFYAGPDVHIIDCFALTDPLLAQLPAQPRWRIGHFTRKIPAGYVATVSNGRNVLVSPDVAGLYGDVRQVVAGPIWSFTRLQAIRRLNRRGIKVHREYQTEPSACDAFL